MVIVSLRYGKQDLQDCLTAVVENVVNETILKTVNLNMLMHTRRVRILACKDNNLGRIPSIVARQRREANGYVLSNSALLPSSMF